MHEHLEIILPPPHDWQASGAVKKDVEDIMKSFQRDEDDGGWWDYFMIGGRWAGQHVLSRIEPAVIQSFRERLAAEKITVSGVQFGKPDLSPASQIPRVDSLWRKMVPGGGDQCVLFGHAAPEGDVCTVGKLGPHLNCDRLILCTRSSSGMPKPHRMAVASFWNGIEHQETDFNGNVAAFIEAQSARDASAYPEPLQIGPEWIAVTVDYHC